MARVKIKLPEQTLFQTELRVRVTDLNYGAHLSNVAILEFAHDTRVQFLKSLGYTEFDLEGMSLIQSDAEISYKSQAYLGDNLIVTIFFGEWSSRGFELVYCMCRKSDDQEIARVKTGLIFYNYKIEKAGLIPEAFKKKINI